ncbi:IS110 family transposase [Bacteroides ovatus]|nr:IS110 family transposase [Bacteroides ovatus]
MAFLSEICDITRFRNAEQLAAYIGMIPDVPLQRRERWDGGYYHAKTRRYAL